MSIEPITTNIIYATWNLLNYLWNYENHKLISLYFRVLHMLIVKLLNFAIFLLSDHSDLCLLRVRRTGAQALLLTQLQLLLTVKEEDAHAFTKWTMSRDKEKSHQFVQLTTHIA